MTRSEPYDWSEWVAENRQAAEEADAARCNAISDEQAGEAEREQQIRQYCDAEALDRMEQHYPRTAALIEQVNLRGIFDERVKWLNKLWTDGLRREAACVRRELEELS
jgi:hypothetical protein